MQSRSLVGALLVSSLVLLAGCNLLQPLFTGTPAPAPGKTQVSNATPTGSPGATDGGNATPAPGATAAPVPQNPLVPRFNTLGDLALGYLLVGNSGAALGGSASGPSALVGDNAMLINNAGGALVGNAGGALAGNSGGALVGNAGAGLIGNSGAGLIGNSGGAYRIAATIEAVSNGFVYLTTPDERLYVNADRRVLQTLTSPDGTFKIFAPATESLVVNVLLKANRRLTALVDTSASASASAKVDLASTLVTEYLRAKAAQYGFTFRDVLTDAGARAALASITDLTRELVASEEVVGTFQPADLALNNLPTLRHKYVIAFGERSKPISDGWVSLLKAVLDDPDAPDLKYRPLAITTVDTSVAAGLFVLAVGAAPDGSTYVVAQNVGTTELHRVKPNGDKERLFAKRRLGDDALGLVQSLKFTPEGKMLIPDHGQGIVALFDPTAAFTDPPFMNFLEPDSWTNPKLLFDAYNLPTNGSLPLDVALDDDADPGMYLADAKHHSVWYIKSVFGTQVFPEAPLAGVIVDNEGQVPGATDSVPAAIADQVKLNTPSAIAFHKRADGSKYLFVADAGDQILIEINLETKAVRRIAGVVPPHNGLAPRLASCYSPTEEGSPAVEAHLNFPNQILFDAKERLVFADTRNNLVRLVDVFAPTPRIWTVAGRFQPDDDTCGTAPDLPPFALGNGEARGVAIGDPVGMGLDAAGNLLLSDNRTNRVRKLWLGMLD